MPDLLADLRDAVEFCLGVLFNLAGLLFCIAAVRATERDGRAKGIGVGMAIAMLLWTASIYFLVMA
ncbi:MAG: hypothetical protein KDB18_12015 [Salinibacterium sp.]|nr:hypothetical protein [Salinibacterium sp.]